ncbi:hypothetical protein GEMRC1_010702 [Eukaryota sp. GEM-RC1]
MKTFLVTPQQDLFIEHSETALFTNITTPSSFIYTPTFSSDILVPHVLYIFSSHEDFQSGLAIDQLLPDFFVTYGETSTISLRSIFVSKSQVIDILSPSPSSDPTFIYDDLSLLSLSSCFTHSITVELSRTESLSEILAEKFSMFYDPVAHFTSCFLSQICVRCKSERFYFYIMEMPVINQLEMIEVADDFGANEVVFVSLSEMAG